MLCFSSRRPPWWTTAASVFSVSTAPGGWTGKIAAGEPPYSIVAGAIGVTKMPSLSI